MAAGSPSSPRSPASRRSTCAPSPDPAGQWQVSTAGGGSPRWRRDGKELFFLSADNKIMAVPVRLGPTFQADAPTALFSVRPDSLYDVSADGQRFLVNNPSGEERLAASDSAHRLDGAPQGIDDPRSVAAGPAQGAATRT